MNPLSTRPNRWRPITVFNLLVGLLFSISAVGQPAFLKEGLVAYYPFNGNANDGSGNGNDGVASGTTPFSDRFNKEVGALRFNGDGANVKLGPQVTSVISNGVFSFSFWVKISSGGTWSPRLMTSGMVDVGIDSTTGSAKVFYGGSGFDSGNNIWSPDRIESSKYYNIAGTYDRFKAVLYINGKLVATQTSSWGAHGYKNATATVGINPENGSDRFSGAVDDVRIYNRALSDGEVKALYDYESAPQPLNPRIASATAQIVNGFVVGATITDGGYGYVSNPVVTIIGGGGTGAKATATQFNGVVTSITITNPGIGYTSAPTITIAPPPFPPRKATSTAQIVNGFVVGIKVTDGGFGYDSPPTVLLVGGGGSGATAVATVANGVVTAITITNPGTGYTSVPIVRIASPPFAPKLGIETSKVFVHMSVVLGRKYQLEASTDLNTWTTTGPAFFAQDEELVQEFDVNQVGRYFRINQVP